MSSDVRTELERKKARLAALKLEKARKEQLKCEQNENAPPDSSETSSIRLEADQILKSLNLNEEVKPIGFASHLPNGESRSQKTKRKLLVVSQESQTSIPPKSFVNYDKETQTIENRDSFDDDFDEHAHPGIHDDNDWAYDDTEFMAVYDDPASFMMLSRTGDLPSVNLVQAKSTEIDEKAKNKKKLHYTAEELKAIEESDAFLSFLQRASCQVIKCLVAPNTIFKDYTGADLDDDLISSEKPMLTAGPVFFDEIWSKNRCISSLNWSTKHSELIAVSYQENSQALHQPPGVVLLWNTRVERSVPEFVLHSQSPVTEVIFAPFQPNLIIGGTYDGIVNIWDIRMHRRLPVMRTNLSSPHTQPIRALQAGGSSNAPTLQSLSSDGILATWSLDMLSQPNESIDLNIINPMKTIAPMCMSAVVDPTYAQQQISKRFLIGSESGDALLADTSSQSNNAAQTGSGSIKATFSGHSGPIFAIRSHPHIPQPGAFDQDCDFTRLFITASEDFTMQLWSVDTPAKPLHTFSESFEPIHDCDWSPIHPAMFASIDLSSELLLWNINADSEVPISRIKCDRRGAFFSRCLFNPNGLSIACGDSTGHLQLFSLNEQRVAPRTEDWTTFKRRIAECSDRQLRE